MDDSLEGRPLARDAGQRHADVPVSSMLGGAVYRLPQFGKRLYIEVDLLEAPSIKKKSDLLEEDEQEREAYYYCGP